MGMHALKKVYKFLEISEGGPNSAQKLNLIWSISFLKEEEYQLIFSFVLLFKSGNR